MRISDWSSDVCSSDLFADRILVGRRLRGGERRLEQREGRMHGVEPGERHRHVVRGDRTSAVSGKSVSVRVDLGGRRIIKKKKNQKQLLTHNKITSLLVVEMHSNDRTKIKNNQQ